MSATVQYLGGMTLGAAMPEVAAAVAVFLAPLTAQLAAAFQAKAALTLTPPSLATNLALAEQIVVGIQAAISLGLPGVDFQLDALATLIATITGQIAAVAALEAALGVGIHVYASQGDAASVAPGGQVPPGTLPASQAGAITLMAITPEARAALGAFFGATI